MPEIGPVSIAGLTFKSAKETINQIIDNQLIGTTATLTLGNLRSVNIFVLGEASKPGMYTISALSTLTNAVFTNGGVKSTGSLRNIQLKRNGAIISDFDFYDLLLKGDTSNDLRLMSGDVVFIPPTQNLVGIAGEVKRPGIYELKDNENAEELISYAGGLSAKADLSSIEIERIDTSANSISLVNVDLSVSPFSKLELKDGDKLSIYPVTEKLNNAVLLRGHTPKPGFYPWIEGQRILDIISGKNDLLPMTDMNYVLIKRESKLGQGYEFIHVNLQELFEGSTSQDNIILMDRDEIILFPSLLNINLIRTVETDSGYDNNNHQLSTYYAKKSVIEMELSKNNLSDLSTINTESHPKEPKYFHYYIYDYCVIDENYLNEILSEVFSDSSSDIDLGTNIELTQYCRAQIIDPILDLIKQQSTPNNPEQTITIFGNVIFPGTYPLTQNASVKNGLAAAGGLSGLTYTDEIDISKKVYPDKEVLESNRLANIDEIENIMLDPLDTITVKKLGYTPSLVEINGEVYFPGQYPVTENESLTNLIKRAGGLKEKASLKNIFFQRTSLIESELRRFEEAQANLKKQLLLVPQDNIGSDENDEDYLSKILALTEQELPAKELLGRLIIDGEAIFSDTAKDIILMNGDLINIPKKPQTVKVIGEVYAPNSHFFDPDYDYDDYIDLSGGLNNYADEESIYIIKQNGSVNILGSSGGFFRGASNSLEAGDTIVIPVKIDTFSGLKATTEITQIVYQMALAAAAVNSF